MGTEGGGDIGLLSMTVYDTLFLGYDCSLWLATIVSPSISDLLADFFSPGPPSVRNLFDRVTGFSISLDRLSYRLYSTKRVVEDYTDRVFRSFFLKYLLFTNLFLITRHFVKIGRMELISISIISKDSCDSLRKIVICRRGEIFFSTHIRPPISSFSPCVGVPYNYRAENVLSRDTRFPSRFYYFPFLLLLLLFLPLSRRLCPDCRLFP